MKPMYVLTVKKDGGTQDVVGFYKEGKLKKALQDAADFLNLARDSRRAIIRLEFYNPSAEAVGGE